MRFFSVQDRRYAAWETLEGVPGLLHAFSTRGLDVSPRRDGHSDLRKQRRQMMVRDFGLDPERLCYCEQVHGSQIAVIDAPRAGGPLPGTDAVITTVASQPLMVFSADCPLVLIVDPQARVLGLVHASWRCTVARLTQRVAETMCARFGCRPRRVLAGIGPSAGPKCYEVGADVYRAASRLPERDRLFRPRGSRMTFDLWLANRMQLEAAGVPSRQVETAGICTMTRTDLFYSYRCDGPGCGHFALLAALT